MDSSIKGVYGTDRSWLEKPEKEGLIALTEKEIHIESYMAPAIEVSIGSETIKIDCTNWSSYYWC
ncbi:hypothetical protein ACOI1C_20615 [Bacillus sp. DJP31]|uniref:hypothetical protein n=1 Tax=Bacillus sp. DJP31 TaxID=3409789 RepID=UPI003BB67081